MTQYFRDAARTGLPKALPIFGRSLLTLFELGEGNPNFFDLPLSLKITSNESIKVNLDSNESTLMRSLEIFGFSL